MCPNSIQEGSLVLMLGPKHYRGVVAKVILKEDEWSDYDWRVQTHPEEKDYIPCWDEELLLLPTNI